MKSPRRVAVRLGALVVGLLGAALARQAMAGPSVEDLLQKTDDLFRGTSSQGRISMHVKTERWDRTLTMQVWSEGRDKTLIQILSPAKEKGTATLKVGNDIWNYLPKVDRTIKVPSSMMAGSWMGSHFTNDDIVHDSRFIDDYECELTGSPEDGHDHYAISCVTRPNAPVVWGRVDLTLGARDELVQEIRFFDEKGDRVRTLTYTDIGDLGGRRLPRLVRVVPADKPDEFTEVAYEELQFDVELPARTFSLRALKP